MKKSPLNQQGKAAKRWIAFRSKWLKDNPPNHQGYYICGICGSGVHYSQVELDHIIPRSKAPHLKYDPDNIQPTHHWCNSQKGSKSVEAYKAERYQT